MGGTDNPNPLKRTRSPRSLKEGIVNDNYNFYMFHISDGKGKKSAKLMTRKEINLAKMDNILKGGKRIKRSNSVTDLSKVSEPTTKKGLDTQILPAPVPTVSVVSELNQDNL